MSSFDLMLQSAVPAAAPVVDHPGDFEAEGHATKEHPRLRVQAAAGRTKRRHLFRAARRLTVLGMADAAVIFGARELLRALRSAPAVGGFATSFFPEGFMGGFGSASAILVGLVFAGAYGSQERWASAGPVFKGAALGAALVFVTRTVSRRLLDGMLGFSGGVMIAASFWSLLAPAIELSFDRGEPPWLPAAIAVARASASTNV